MKRQDGKRHDGSSGKLAEGDATLIDAARIARSHSYSPYSHFRVGAAVRVPTGEIYTGANVENASYGLCVCAERTAVLAAALAGHREITAIAVASDIAPPASPCGMCRQTLLEFTRDPTATRVIAVGPDGDPATWTLAELIPHGFTGAQLEPKAPATVTPPRARRRAR